MNMNTAQARVIDPVLTTIAQGYKSAERVGHVLFPVVPVSTRGGNIIEFGLEAFRIVNARRAPGSHTGRVSFGHRGKPFQLDQDALDGAVPREHLQDAAAVPGIDLGTRTVNKVMGILTLGLEYEQAKIATNPANYDADHKLALAGTDKWSDPVSKPGKAVSDAKEKIRLTAGVDPNRMVISKPILNALKEHPEIKDRFKYTSAESITPAMLAAYFEVDTLAVGKAAALASNADNPPFVDIWGNFATLAYTPEEGGGYEVPSFGYTYTFEGHPFVEQARWDGDSKSWIYGVAYERSAVLTGAASGFLFQNVV